MSIHSKQYINDAISLARSIQIKSEITATLLNKYLISKGELVDEHDKATWKYYLNMNGEYHPTDSPTMVNSMDATNTSIEFNKQLLIDRPVLKHYYSYESNAYNDLLEANKTNRTTLINIVNPIGDIGEIINAPDNTILHYNTSLIEPREIGLLQYLQNNITLYQNTWNNKSFSVTDDLYVASQLGQLYLSLVRWILNYRLSKINTNEAHTYYIKMRLKSSPAKSIELDQLNETNLLWLYRNIRYIEQNNGTTENLNALIDNLFDIDDVSVSRLVMKESVKHNGNSIKTKLNSRYNLQQYTNRNIETDSGNLGKRPTEVGGNLSLKEIDDFEKLVNNNQNTEVIEISLLDRSNIEKISTSIMAWGYCSANSANYRNLSLDVITSETTYVNVTPLSGFLALHYVMLRMQGMSVNDISQVPIHIFKNKDTTTIEDLRLLDTASVVPSDILLRLHESLPTQSDLDPSSITEINSLIDIINNFERMKYDSNTDFVHGSGVIKYIKDTLVSIEFTNIDLATQLVGFPDIHLINNYEELFNSLIKTFTGTTVTTDETMALINNRIKGIEELTSYTSKYIFNRPDTNKLRNKIDSIVVEQNITQNTVCLCGISNNLTTELPIVTGAMSGSVLTIIGDQY